jgi:hypothetical protein
VKKHRRVRGLAATDSVTRGYFEALRVSLKKGRFFTASDDDEGARVIILDERGWPNCSAERRSIGRRVVLPKGRQRWSRKPGLTSVWMQVVGVVAGHEEKGLVEGVEESRSGAYYFRWRRTSRQPGAGDTRAGRNRPR